MLPNRKCNAGTNGTEQGVTEGHSPTPGIVRCFSSQTRLCNTVLQTLSLKMLIADRVPPTTAFFFTEEASEPSCLDKGHNWRIVATRSAHSVLPRPGVLTYRCRLLLENIYSKSAVEQNGSRHRWKQSGLAPVRTKEDGRNRQLTESFYYVGPVVSLTRSGDEGAAILLRPFAF